MTELFDPLTLRRTTARNRVMVSPMCQYSCDARDGLATDWHLVHLGSRAVGGAGIVMAEATAVEPRGRISPEDLGLWSREHADALAPVADFVRSQGALPGVQLAHAGRKGSKTRPWEGSEPLQPDEGGWETIAPSGPYPYDEEPPRTREMNTDDVEQVVESFARAAEYALEAGFEIAEVHAAHGYLLHEFLSPVANRREDEYGGSFENRIRLAVEVTEAVREVWPEDKPVFVRVSATDWLPDRDAWDLESTSRLVPHLVDAGADLVDVSGGGIHPDQQLPRFGPGYQTTYAEALHEEHGDDVAVGTVGGITDASHAEAIVGNERADLAILGREFLYDPYWAHHAAEDLGVLEEEDVPVQYRRGFF